MRTRVTLAALLFLVALGVVVGRHLTRAVAPPEASPFHASNPGLFGSTGHPQLVEFFHHA